MKRLYRNPDEQMIAGVCSGIADYLNVDPTAVRLAFLLLLFAGGGGLLIYLVMWIIMPIEPTAAARTVSVKEKAAIEKIEKPAAALEKKAPTVKKAPAAKKKPAAQKPAAKSEPAEKTE